MFIHWQRTPTRKSSRSKEDDEEEKEDKDRRRKEIFYSKKQKKNTTYQLGTELDASPASPVPSSSSRSLTGSCLSSSPGASQSTQTPGGRKGRGEGGTGSQANFMNNIHAKTSCGTATYDCTGFVEGNSKLWGEKTTALSGLERTDQWEQRSLDNLWEEASLATAHQSHDCCNSQGGLQQE